MLRRSCCFALPLWLFLTAVVAAQPYKALIVTGQNGHDWKGTTPVLWKIVEQTGLFTVDVGTAPPKIPAAKGQKPIPADMSGFCPDLPSTR